MSANEFRNPIAARAHVRRGSPCRKVVRYRSAGARSAERWEAVVRGCRSPECAASRPMAEMVAALAENVTVGPRADGACFSRKRTSLTAGKMKTSDIVVQILWIAYALWHIVARRSALHFYARLRYRPGDARRGMEESSPLAPRLVGMALIALLCAADLGLMPLRHA